MSLSFNFKCFRPLLWPIFLFIFGSFRVESQIISYQERTIILDTPKVKTGAEQLHKYLPQLKDKSIAVVVNQTSVVGKVHLVDTLLKLGIKINKIFGPEHGFRGESDAGEKVLNSIDYKTNIPVISLYGNNKKPSEEQLKDIDLVLFDIQDVGCRFYTYISTLTYIMEVCATISKPIIILDRPNPNGHFIDGPLLEKEFNSFVGLHPVPIVHGCTIGEYAKMVKGESWIANASKLKLTIIQIQNWDHKQKYNLPIAPSPNLPNMESVWLYPSLCLFEGTKVSIGRGTNKPFQCIGFPEMKEGNYNFVPKSVKGAKNPPFKDTLCNGFILDDFSNNYLYDLGQIYIFWLQETYKLFPNKNNFFNPYFEKLVGTNKFRKQIESGLSEEEIRKSWKNGLNSYKVIRKKYLLYNDFE